MAEYQVSSSEMMVLFRGLVSDVGSQEVSQDATHVVPQDNIAQRILEYCTVPRAKKEIAAYLGYADDSGFTKRHLKPLLEAEKLVMTIPDKPRSVKQKYVAKKNDNMS